MHGKHHVWQNDTTLKKKKNKCILSVYERVRHQNDEKKAGNAPY